MKKNISILSIFLCFLCSGYMYATSPVSGYTGIPRMKVIIDNDFCGDPDGYFQLVHHLLSPSLDIRGIIGSHLKQGVGFTDRVDSAVESCEKAENILSLMGLSGKYIVCAGSNEPMSNPEIPKESDGVELIIREAMQATPENPLYVLCGGPLTNIASAWLKQPEIGKRIILIWIGGQEYKEGAVPPPGYSPVEYNLALSVPAAQTVFNQSDIRLWQIPRDAYRQCIYGVAEMHAYIRPCGKIGQFLSDSIDNLMKTLDSHGVYMGEVYIMGDSPLVLLTALQTGFEADPASSAYVSVQAPCVADDGSYRYNPDGRVIRVYTRLDTRLMFEDFNAKLRNKYTSDLFKK